MSDFHVDIVSCVWFGVSFGLLLLLAVLEYAVGFGLGLEAVDGDGLCVWSTGGVLQGLVFRGSWFSCRGFLFYRHGQRVFHSTPVVHTMGVESQNCIAEPLSRSGVLKEEWNFSFYSFMPVST